MKQIKFYLFSILIIVSSRSIAQHQIWYFGNKAGIDFNGPSPVALTDGMSNTPDYTAAISNNSGNLLFYTDSRTIWDKTHNVMQNGTGLLGENSNGQATLIIRRPESNTYYIFTVGYLSSSNGLRYHTVDITQNGGNGAVVTKNSLLLTPSTERLEAVYNAANHTYWVITHGYNNNKFYAYKITTSGLDTVPVISSVGTVHSGSNNTMGQLTISPQKNKLACAVYNANKVDLLDFDLNTGIVSNPISLTGIPNAWGTAFSPDGTKLYVTKWTDDDVIQMDVSSGNATTIMNSSKIVGHVNGPDPTYKVGYLQLAPDNRIYGAVMNDTALMVINDPNNADTLCHLVDNGFHLAGKRSTAGLCRSIQQHTNIGVEEISRIEFTLYPNPAADKIRINLNGFYGTKMTYSIFDAKGALCGNGSFRTGTDISIAHLNQGIYYLQLYTSDLRSAGSTKFLKKD